MKIAVNKYIREGRELNASQLSKETGFGKNLFQLYKFLIEIKPKAQTSLKEATSERERIQAIVNKAKWQAAYDFCRSKGMGFRVLTQDQIFKNPNKRRKRK